VPVGVGAAHSRCSASARLGRRTRVVLARRGNPPVVGQEQAAGVAAATSSAAADWLGRCSPGREGRPGRGPLAGRGPAWAGSHPGRARGSSRKRASRRAVDVAPWRPLARVGAVLGPGRPGRVAVTRGGGQARPGHPAATGGGPGARATGPGGQVPLGHRSQVTDGREPCAGRLGRGTVQVGRWDRPARGRGELRCGSPFERRRRALIASRRRWRAAVAGGAAADVPAPGFSHELRNPAHRDHRVRDQPAAAGDVTWDGGTRSSGYLSASPTSPARLGAWVNDCSLLHIEFGHPAAQQAGRLRTSPLFLEAAVAVLPRTPASQVTVGEMVGRAPAANGCPPLGRPRTGWQVFVNLLGKRAGHNPHGTKVVVTAAPSGPGTGGRGARDRAVSARRRRGAPRPSWPRRHPGGRPGRRLALGTTSRPRTQSGPAAARRRGAGLRAVHSPSGSWPRTGGRIELEPDGRRHLLPGYPAP